MACVTVCCRRVALCLLIFVQCHAFALAAPIPVASVQRADAVSFEKEILPILQKNCLACHSASEKQGDLILESPQAILKGGDNGPAAIPGRGAESLILRLASQQSDPVMPPAGNDVAARNLSSEELGLLQLWINQGAKGSGGIDSLSPRQWHPLPPGVHPVQSLALAEDGQYVAVGRANQIFLYHVPTGTLVTRLADPALDQFAAPSAAGTVGAELTGIAHRDLVQSLTFNIDGDLLASGSFREVKLWRRPRDVTRLTMDLGEAGTAVAVSPDKNWIAAGTANHSIRLYRASTGEPGPVLTGHTAAVTSLRFTPDGQRLLSGSLDASVRQWQLPEGTAAGSIETPSPVNAIELVNLQNPTPEVPQSPQWLVTGHADNMLRLWELPKTKSTELAAPLPNTIRSSISPDGSLLAVFDEPGNVRVVSLLSTPEGLIGKEVATWQVPGGVSAATFVRLADVPVPTPEASAEGYAIVTGSPDGMLRAWSLPQHELLRQFRGDAVRVTALMASDDGKLLTSGLENGAMTQWDVSTVARPQPDLQTALTIGAAAKVTALSPSRKLLALVGVKDGQPAIFLQNLESQQFTATFVGHQGVIKSLAFSANEARLISGGDDKSIRIWNLQSPTEAPKVLPELPAAVTAVGCNPDASQVLAGFSDNALRLYNPSAETPETLILKEFSGHGGPVFAAGFFGGQPFSLSTDNSVRFWNAADGAQLRVFNVPVATTAFTQSSDGQRLVLAGEDRQVRFYQTDNGNTLHTLAGFTQPIISVSLAADGQQVAALTADGELLLWSVPNQRLLEVVPASGLSLALFTLPNVPLTTAAQQGQMAAWTPAFQRQFEGNAQPVTDLVYHPNGQVMFMTAADGSFRGYNTQNAQQTFATGHGAKVFDLAISPDGNTLATAGENAQVRLWNTSGGGVGPQQLTGFTGPTTRVAFSSEGTRVIATTSGEHPAMLLFDFQSGQLLERTSSTNGEYVGCYSLKPSAGTDPALQRPRVLDVTAKGGRIWEAAYLKTVPGHGGPVTSLAEVRENPRQVFAGSTDTTIRRWNLDNGQALQQFNHGGAVTAIAVRSDGQRLASASDNHTAKLFNINGQQIAELRGDVRRRVAQTRAQQQLNAANARLNVAKQILQQAEQDLPNKTNAEKALAENLEKANQEVKEKQAALDKSREEKLVAEKAALEATGKAKTALAEKETAEKAAQLATVAMQAAQATMQRLQQASNSDPANEQLKNLLAQATQELTRCQQVSQTATSAVQAPTQKAQEMAQLANTAAQNVTNSQKPYSDALTALKTAQSNQNLLSQQQVLAARELKIAQDLVPLKKDAVTQAEAAQQQSQQAIDAANMAAQEADQPIRSVVFSPDGKTLLTAGDFANLHLWDAETGGALAAYAGHAAQLKGALFVDDAALVSISDDKSVRVWELSPGWTLERTIGSVDDAQAIAHRVTSVDFNREASRLLIAGGIPSRSGELQVYDLTSGQRVLYLPQAHDDVVYSARFSPDGRHIASGGADKYLRTFDLATSQQLRRFEGHTNYVLGVAWKGDGQIISSAGADNTVKVWEAETADQQRTIENQFGRHVTSIQYIGETDSIVTSCGDKLVRMHNASNGGLERNFGEIQIWPHCVACTPDRSIVAAGDASGTVTIWNGQNGQFLRRLTADGAP